MLVSAGKIYETRNGFRYEFEAVFEVDGVTWKATPFKSREAMRKSKLAELRQKSEREMQELARASQQSMPIEPDPFAEVVDRRKF